MRVTRLEDAVAYDAPNHFDMRSLRLQGFNEGGPKSFWVGLSHFLPRGGAGPDSSPLEKVYVVIAGQLVVRANGEEVVLRELDSCTIPGGEMREVLNTSNSVATMLVVMPYAPGSK
ncbi:MAG: cupin domain-containing protein [Sinobacteraceae bacterium]|nr:cupin domain-containing protein [Nevskiaceae bacterium]